MLSEALCTHVRQTRLRPPVVRNVAVRHVSQSMVSGITVLRNVSRIRPFSNLTAVNGNAREFLSHRSFIWPETPPADASGYLTVFSLFFSDRF